MKFVDRSQVHSHTVPSYLLDLWDRALAAREAARLLKQPIWSKGT
jgi:hypothetical protein